MTVRPHKPRVAMLCALAPDLRAALADRLDLVAPDMLPQLSPDDRKAINGAVTMAMQGAPAAMLDLLPSLQTLAGGGIVLAALFLHILTEFRRRPAAMAEPILAP